MKSLVDGIGALSLTKGGLVVKPEVGEDIWDLDISRWGDAAIMDVGRVVIMGVEGKLVGREFGMMNANKESFFSLIIPSISV